MNKRCLLFLFLITLLFPLTSWAQNLMVTGKVISSDDGLGLPGVTVQVKGGTGGTITDIDGNYSLQVAQNGTLVFSFVGFTTQEIKVNKIPSSVTVTVDNITVGDVAAVNITIITISLFIIVYSNITVTIHIFCIFGKKPAG